MSERIDFEEADKLYAATTDPLNDRPFLDWSWHWDSEGVYSADSGRVFHLPRNMESNGIPDAEWVAWIHCNWPKIRTELAELRSYKATQEDRGEG